MNAATPFHLPNQDSNHPASEVSIPEVCCPGYGAIWAGIVGNSDCPASHMLIVGNVMFLVVTVKGPKRHHGVPTQNKFLLAERKTCISE